MAIKHEDVVARGDLLTSTMWNKPHIIEDMTIKGIHIDNLQIGTDHLIDDAVTTAKLAILDWLDLVNRTTDPVLAVGRLWFREDLVKLRFSPDGVEVKEIAWAGDLSSHITTTPIDHPDLSITTAKIADAAITRLKLKAGLLDIVRYEALNPITPTLSGWTTEPLDLANITDFNNATSTTTGETVNGAYAPWTTGYITYDTEELGKFRKIYLRVGQWTNTAGAKTTVEIQVSEDGTTWTTIGSRTISSTTESIGTVTVTTIQTLRYARLRCYGDTGGATHYFKIYAFEVMPV